MAAPKENRYAVGNNGGRPPHYDTPEQLMEAVDGYFVYIEGEWHEVEVEVKDPKTGKKSKRKEKVWDRLPEPATITGLALYLGFGSRASLDDYEKREEFSYIIKKGRARVEHGYEKALHMQSPTGAIFALKNMGWKDKTETDLTTKGESFNLRDLVKFE
ncbi:terminase small subunit [Rufibacter soli]